MLTKDEVCVPNSPDTKEKHIKIIWKIKHKRRGGEKKNETEKYKIIKKENLSYIR